MRLHRQESGIPLRGRAPQQRKPLPALKEGQVHCPLCQKPVTPTPAGGLRTHKDLQGNFCGNKRAPRPIDDSPTDADPHRSNP